MYVFDDNKLNNNIYHDVIFQMSHKEYIKIYDDNIYHDTISQMSDKEYIEIFEKIWDADIINKTEPLYSIAISVVNIWLNAGGLRYYLSSRLLNKWRCTLRDYIASPEHETNDFFQSMKEKYQDAPQLLRIIGDMMPEKQAQQLPGWVRHM
jgi:hypothetical protein